MLLASLTLVLTETAHAHVQKYSLQAGAWGDDSSRGNKGVRAEIRIRIYGANSGDFDYFWVGDNLADGSFIQFGYSYEPGYYCLRGHSVKDANTCLGKSENIDKSDARWQWQYWPDASVDDFYYGMGPANSAGDNGTWRTFSIIPDSANGWSFALDGDHVDGISFQPVKSKDPAYVVAEKTTDSPVLGDLGPVEFRNLAYLQEDGWHPVDSLIVLRGCGALSDCSIQNPYGVVLLAPNEIVAGSSIQLLADGELLWTSGYATLNVDLGPNAMVYAWVLSNSSTFQGSFSLHVPRGMFANIELEATQVHSASIFGMLGAVDEFRRWTGDASSSDTSIRVLMDGDKSVHAIWTTNYTVPLEVGTGLLVLLLVLLVVVLKSRKGRVRASTYPLMGSYYCPICNAPLSFIEEYQRYYCYNCQRYL